MDSKLKLIIVVILAVILGDVTIYVIHPLGDDFYKFTDLSTVVFGTGGSIIGLYAAKLFGFPKTKLGKGIFFLALGLVAETIGNGSWSYLEVWLGQEVPTVSIADPGYLGFYLFSGIGVYFMYRAAGEVLKRNRKFAVLFLLKIIAVSALLSVYGFWPNFVDPNLNDLERGVLLTYIIGSMTLLAGMFVITFSLLGKKFFGPWIVILIAFLIHSFADVLYSQLAYLYEAENPLTILYDMTYLMLGVGFFYALKVYNNRDFGESEEEERIINANLR